MFRPIKNFLTYIHKSATNKTFFRGNNSNSNSTATTTDDTSSPASLSSSIEELNNLFNKTEKSSETIIPSSSQSKEERTNTKIKSIMIKVDPENKTTEKEMNEIEVSGESQEANQPQLTEKVVLVNEEHKYSSSETFQGDSLQQTGTVFENEFDENDIETQIKSSIMLKKGPLGEMDSNLISENVMVQLGSSNDGENIIDFDETEKLENHSPKMENTLDSCPNIKEQDNKVSEKHEKLEIVTLDTDVKEGVLNEMKDAIPFDNTINDVQQKNISENFEKQHIHVTSEKEFIDIRTISDPVLNQSIEVERLTTSEEDPLNILNENNDIALENLKILQSLSTTNESTSSFHSFNNDLRKNDLITTVKNAKHYIDTNSGDNNNLEWLGVDVSEEVATSVLTKKVTIESDILTRNDDDLEKVVNYRGDERGEGSDSGLGSESSTALHSKNTSLNKSLLEKTSENMCPLKKETKVATTIDIEHNCDMKTSCVTKAEEEVTSLNYNPAESTLIRLDSDKSHNNLPKPKRSNLKRRRNPGEVIDRTEFGSTIPTLSANMDVAVEKKPKRSINFDLVQIYYFPRQQGFSCVPSAGGCTLGMSFHHVDVKVMTLVEHMAELRRAHRLQLQEINPRSSSSDDSDESEEDYLSEGSGSDLDADSNGFLQPVSPKQRRAILKAAGIRKIDPSEKIDCRKIRNSREICGCSCRDFCDPETCTCSQSGIKCQVDRDMFPCGCSQEACGNKIGRIEFNPSRVKTHFIHTLMRLEMENRQYPNPYYVKSGCITTIQRELMPVSIASTSNYYPAQLQSFSNYNSAYVSTVYNSNMEQNQSTIVDNYFTQKSTESEMYTQSTIEEMAHCDSSSDSNCITSTIPMTTHPYSLETVGKMYASNAVNNTIYEDIIPTSSYHNKNYVNMDGQVAGNIYTDYNNDINNSSLNNESSGRNFENGLAAYNACALPSDPPCGIATTTTSCSVDFSVTTQLPNMEAIKTPFCTLLNATAVSTMDTTDLNTNDYINLNTTIASSSHLSEINDLLQHNRHTTPVPGTVTTASSSECVTSERITEIDCKLKTPFNISNNAKELTAISDAINTSSDLINDVNSTLLIENNIKSSNELLENESDLILLSEKSTALFSHSTICDQNVPNRELEDMREINGKQCVVRTEENAVVCSKNEYQSMESDENLVVFDS